MRNLIRSHCLRLATAPLAAAGLLSMGLPQTPAQALTIGGAGRNSYQSCTSALLGAKISEADAAAACGGALYPRDLSDCVTRISGNSKIAVADILSSCQRVRRPVELASCYVKINRDASDAVATDVLESCRRSLLPDRYSDCVVGVKRETKLPIADVLTSCIAASNRPREVLPNFVPAGQPIPLPSGSMVVPGGTSSDTTTPNSTVPSNMPGPSSDSTTAPAAPSSAPSSTNNPPARF